MPRVLCTHCGHAELIWVSPSMRATVYSTTTVRRRAEQGGDYNVSIIELEEGPRLMSRVEGVPPSAVVIGLAVRAAVARDADGNAVLVFHPVGNR